MVANETTLLPAITAGIGRFLPPTDPLKAVFTPEIRDDWRKSLNEELLYRLQVLCACGPYPSDRTRTQELRCRRARKAAWETYLFTAYACGMFEGERGKEVRSRLASTDAECFRSAMAECMVCWFLAGRKRVPLSANAPGRNSRNLDMQIVANAVDVGIEVKAPFRERPKERVWCGDDSDKIVDALKTANKQFANDRPNILALVPCLRRSCYSHRHDLVKGAFGQSKITWQINTQTGETGPTEVKFFPDGQFLNTERPGGKPLKPDGFPGYRRISAVVCIEETIAERYPFPDPFALLDENSRGTLWPHWERARDLHFSAENYAWVEHNVLVLHNPYAYHAIPHDLFGEYPQLVPVGDVMEWTDGEEVIV